VKEERRQRVDNQPYGAAFLDVFSAPFDSTDCFPYSHSIIGVMEDLEAAPVDSVQAFFAEYYRPSNASLVVVGDFDAAAAKSLVQAYFGDIPAGGPIPPVASCKVSYAAGARTQDRTDPLAQLPAVITAYRIPPHGDPDTRPLQLLGVILGQGEGSRLNQALVRDGRVAVQAAAGVESRGGPGVLYAFAVAGQQVTVDSLAHALAAQITRLAAGDVQAAELERAKTAFRSTTVFGRQTTHQMAEELQHFARYHASPADMGTDLAEYAKVTLADLARVAGRYLRPENSTTVRVLPSGAPPSSHQHEEEE
jgi:zinc protease